MMILAIHDWIKRHVDYEMMKMFDCKKVAMAINLLGQYQCSQAWISYLKFQMQVVCYPGTPSCRNQEERSIQKKRSTTCFENLPQLAVVLLLLALFQLVSSESTSKCTDNGVSTSLLATIVTCGTTSHGTHYTTFTVLSSSGISRSISSLWVVWLAGVRLAVISALLWELI
jgi:hypothetical protein